MGEHFDNTYEKCDLRREEFFFVDFSNLPVTQRKSLLESIKSHEIKKHTKQAQFLVKVNSIFLEDAELGFSEINFASRERIKQISEMLFDANFITECVIRSFSQ
jgi:hypothetical protein